MFLPHFLFRVLEMLRYFLAKWQFELLALLMSGPTFKLVTLEFPHGEA